MNQLELQRVASASCVQKQKKMSCQWYFFWWSVCCVVSAPLDRSFELSTSVLSESVDVVESDADLTSDFLSILGPDSSTAWPSGNDSTIQQQQQQQQHVFGPGTTSLDLPLKLQQQLAVHSSLNGSGHGFELNSVVNYQLRCVALRCLKKNHHFISRIVKLCRWDS